MNSDGVSIFPVWLAAPEPPYEHLTGAFSWQVLPQQLLGQVCQAEGEDMDKEGLLGLVPFCHQALLALPRSCFMCDLGQGAVPF